MARSDASQNLRKALCPSKALRSVQRTRDGQPQTRAETDAGHFCFPGFLDREEALAVAMAEFPDIKYREEDFDAMTTYRLRKKRS